MQLPNIICPSATTWEKRMPDHGSFYRGKATATAAAQNITGNRSLKKKLTLHLHALSHLFWHSNLEHNWAWHDSLDVSCGCED